MQRPGAHAESSFSNSAEADRNAAPGFVAPANRRRPTVHLTRAGARTEEHGIAAVEFAIGALLLLLIGFGAWEYGLFLNKGQTLANGVRTAARVTATACIPPSDLDNRVASDPDCIGGNKASDDFETLRALQASLGRDWTQVDKILIYKVPGEYNARGQGKPPGFCTSADGEVRSYDDWCTRFDETTQFLYEGSNIPLLKNLDKFFYTADEATAKNNADAAAAAAAGNPPPTTLVQEDDAKVDLVNATFDCSSATSPSAPFCPTKIVDSQPVRKRGLAASSNLGVYVKLKHNLITGLFGREQRIAQWSLFRLEPSPYDNTPYACTGSACDAPPAVPGASADLAVTKTDGLDEVGPNDPLTYTITVRNNGPDNVNGVLIKDPSWPVQLVNLGWTCTPITICESDSGTLLDETVNLAVGQVITFTWNARVKSDVSGMSATIANTATVTASNVTDPTPSNNSATDVTALVKPDLAVTKVDDGLSTASPFQPIEYEIEVTNVGQISVTGATVNWTLPPQLDLTSWQCIQAIAGAVCETTNQTGPFVDTVTIPKTGKVRYVLRGTVRVDAYGSMNPSATVTLPVGLVDDTPGNNTRSDAAATVILRPDLTISKDDAKSFMGPLEETEYTIIAQNTGAYRVDGVRITDTPPAMLSNITWTCTAPPSNTCPAASGAGPIDVTTNLAGGSSLTFKLKATAIASASGTITNRAEIIAPAGLLELSTANNVGDDVEPNVVRFPILVTTKTDGRSFIAPGMSNDYTITVRNDGTVGAKNVSIVDTPPALLTGVTWSCTGATGGATCGAVTSGSGGLNIVRDIPAGGQLTFLLSGTLSTSATGTLTNTVSATNDPAISPSNAPSSTASDSTTIRYPDLAATKSVSPVGAVSPGQNVTYTVKYKNNGPGTATGATLTDPIPSGISAFTTVSCSAIGGATCPVTSPGAISTVQTIPEGGELTFTVTARIAVGATGTVTNTAVATANLATPDAVGGNNTGSISNVVVSPDLFATLTATPASGSSVGPKSVITYTLTVGNTGAAAGTAPVGVGVTLPMPSQIQTFTWTCAGVGGATCPTTSGSGAIDETTTSTLAPGQSLVYTVTGTLKAVPTVGTMTTVGTVVPPAGMAESGSTPNSASVSHTVGHPDVRVVKTASAANVGPGQTFSYTITTTNLGPGFATAIRVTDTFDATKLGTITWTCTGSGCPTASGSGNISEVSGDIPASGTVVYAVSVKVLDAARSSVSNTATVATTNGLVDPVAGNNTNTVTTTIQLPDLVVTKTDGITQISPNQTNSYTITFQNKGPGPVTGVTLADTVDTTKLTVTGWTCAASGGATCPTTPTTSLNATVDLPANGLLTFTLNATVKGTATGSLVNTASITANPAVPDRDTSSVGSENSITDTDTIVIPDLSVTKSDTQTNVAAGQQLTYVIVARNNGPGPVTNAILTDTPPAALTSVTWTCTLPVNGATCPSPASGSIPGGTTFTSIIPSLPALGQVTYNITGTVGPLASGSIIQNVQLNHPGGTVEPPGTSGNNTATDTNTIQVSDLSITKSDGVTNVAGGQPLTYNITVSNSGPGPVIGAVITDTPPASILTGSTPWTCNGTTGGASCPNPGTGRNLSVTATIPSGGSITYRFTGTVDPALTSGTIAQTAGVAQPTGYTDPTPGNNTSTDTDTIVLSDLSVTKTDGQVNVGPDQALTYTIVLSNNGPGPVTNARFRDVLPSALTGVTYQCTSTVGATCPTTGVIAIATGGTITINNVNLLSGQSVTYSVWATVAAGASGTITQTATFNHSSGTEPAGTVANNTATDIDNVLLPDPTVTKTASNGTRGRGQTQTYTITVANSGPGPVATVTLTDVMPAQILTPSVSCAASGGASCPSGTSPLATGATLTRSITNLPSGGSLVFTVAGVVGPTVSSGTVTNTASITASLDRDTTATSNSSTATFTVSSPDLQMSKNRAPSSFVPGQAFAYTLLVTNAGPGSVTGAVIKDATMTNFTGTTWTCATTSGAAVCPPAAPNTAAALATGITTGLMPANSSLTITFNGSIPAAASGSVSNTARVDPPSGQSIVESNTVNNQDAKTDPITQPDISVIKDNGQTQLIPGQAVTYTVTVRNLGATTASNIGVTDTPPASLITGSSPWSCSGTSCVSAGTTRNLSVTLPTLPAGATVVYSMSATVSSTAVAGNLTNTATITSATDPNASNNTDDDTDPVVHPDLGVTKTDGVSIVYPRYAGAYTIVAKNFGPGPITGAKVTDTIPAGLTGVTWTCVASSGASCAASGSGSISASLVNLPANATATFTVNYTVADSFFGSIMNTASIAPPTGFTDPTSSNDSQTDINTSTRANLSIDKNDGLAEVWPGRTYSYSIIVSNAGTVPVTGATVADSIPTELQSATWTCSGLGGGACPASGAGSISTSAVNLPVGSSVTFVLTATVKDTATGSVTNTATVAVPSYTDDSTLANNTDDDIDIITLPDVVVTKGNGVTSLIVGSSTTYTITVKNKGPGPANNIAIADVMSSKFNAGSITWSCAVVSGTGSCNGGGGTGNISRSISLAANAQINFIVTATVSTSATGTLVNTVTATLSSPADRDTTSTGSENTATDTDTLNPIVTTTTTTIATTTTRVFGGT